MGNRKYSEQERQLVVEHYQRTGSINGAAALVGASQNWAYKLLKSRGLTSTCPRWPISLVARAEELYTERRLSCRDVAAVMADELGGEGPSHVWIGTRLKAKGVLRTRGGANRARAEKAKEVDGALPDYAALQIEALHLARGRGLSPRQISAKLGVARSTIMRWLREHALSPADAQRMRAWAAKTPEVAARRRRYRAVIEMRAAGRTYTAIEEATSLSRSQIYLYLRRAGMVKAQAQVRKGLRILPGPPAWES